MTLPTNIDMKALFQATFVPPRELFDSALAAITQGGRSAAIKELWADVEETAEHEPGYIQEPLDKLIKTGFGSLDTQQAGSLIAQFIGGFNLPADQFMNLVKVIVVVNTREQVRESKGIRGYGRAYTLFRQILSIHGGPLMTAMGRRRALEGDITQAACNVEDLQLPKQLERIRDSTRTTDLSQRLVDLWWRVYERPALRILLLLWYLGQEIRNPGNARMPPIENLGELFRQARDFSLELNIGFPFRRNLNELRNAIHRRQTKIHRNLNVDFYDRAGNLLETMTFDEIAKAVEDDIEFCLHADTALIHAVCMTMDDHGAFDAAWKSLNDSLRERARPIEG